MHVPQSVIDRPNTYWKSLDTTHAPIALWFVTPSQYDSSGNGKTLTVAGTTSYDKNPIISDGYNVYFAMNKDAGSGAGCGYSRTDAAFRISGDITVQFLAKIRRLPFTTTQVETVRNIICCGPNSGGTTLANNTQWSVKLARCPVTLKLCFASFFEYDAGVDQTLYFNQLPIPQSEIFHVALVRSGLNYTMYVNCKSQTITAATSPNGGTSAALNIYVGPEINFHVGSIKIVDSALTPAQIKDEYLRVNNLL